MRNPRFRDSVGDLAAPVHGVPKDELIGEDVGRRRRALRLARGAVGLLVLFLALAVVGGIVALVRRNRGDRAEAARAVGGPCGERGNRLARTAADVRLAAEAVQIADTPAAEGRCATEKSDVGLRKLLTGHKRAVHDADFSPDGAQVVTQATTGRRGSGTLDRSPSRDPCAGTGVLSRRRLQPRRQAGGDGGLGPDRADLERRGGARLAILRGTRRIVRAPPSAPTVSGS